NQMIGEPTSDQEDEKMPHHYWKRRELPIARGVDELNKESYLHSSLQMMLAYNNHQHYWIIWSQRFAEYGTTVDGRVLLQAQWRSFTSYTGRIYARNLPLTSLPNEMRNYIMAPKGYQIVSLDINAAEIRFMTYHAKSSSLIHKFQKGIDVLTEIAD